MGRVTNREGEYRGAASLAGAPSWRREPYRVLFPLGVALAWAGVLHWLLHSAGILAEYKPVFHSISQIQGFMMCFAVGFLFTAIPRRTGTAPPAAWQMAVALIAPPGTVVAAWLERWDLSQAIWIALVLVLIGFAIRRFLSAEAARRPPNSFIWIPLSFAIGIVGSVLIAVGASRGESWFWLHDLGRLLLLQGMFLGLIVGVGGMVLPLVTRGEAPADAAATRRGHWERTGHLLAVFVLLYSFWLENRISQSAGLALRSGLTLILLLVSAGIHRPPSIPGLHRWLVWLSAWMIPAGYAMAALFPLQMKAGLHVVFIGGFAFMALSVGLHVTLAHGGYTHLVAGRPWQVPVFGAFLMTAMALRTLCDFDRARFFLWLGAAATAFLMATIVWGSLLLPRLMRKPRSDEVAPLAARTG